MSHDAGGTSGVPKRWPRVVTLLGLALGLGMVTVAVAPNWPGRWRDPATPHLRAACRAWSEGRLDEAVAELGRARAEGEPAAEVDRLWGLVYARAGRPDDALPRLRQAWDQPGRGPDPEVAEALARIHMERFELGEAIAVLDRWAREALTDPRPLVMRAVLDRRIGVERSVTIDHFQEALRRDPARDEARLGLAEILYLHGQFAESAGHYAAYARRHPDDPAGHIGIGISARAQGEVAQAAAALDRALVLAPDDTLALKERAAVDLQQGHPDQALQRLNRAVTADPFDPELRYQRSLVLARVGHRQEADAERRRSEQLRREHTEMAQISGQLADRPADNALRYRAARWMIDHGRADEAAQWARLVLRDQPDHPEANRLLADYLRSRGEPGLANFYQLHATATPPAPTDQPGAHREPGSDWPPQGPSGP
jgi:tetratricopeptide (TPR) repeat protein